MSGSRRECGCEEDLVTGERLEVYLGGRHVRTRSIKMVESITMSDQEVTSKILHVCDDTLQVFPKSEAGNVTPVVKGDNALFRQMDFISKFIERGFVGSCTSLFAGSRGKEEIDDDLTSACHNTDKYKILLDKSNFDWHQSKDSILVVI